MGSGVSGGREGIRTLDLSVANAALSQLSYAPMQQMTFGNITRQAKRRQASWRRRHCLTSASRQQGLRKAQRRLELILWQPTALGKIVGSATLAPELCQSLFDCVRKVRLPTGRL